MAPKAMGRRQQAQADKEAVAIVKGISTICSEADQTELDYVMGRLSDNKNLLQRPVEGPGAFYVISYLLHPFLVRLSCMPPRRLSSLLKQDTLVALLDGTSAAAASQTVPVEKAAMVPASVKKFRHLIAHPKLVDKIMMRLDVLRFSQSELNDPLWTVETKLGIIYMYLKEKPESVMPSVYIEELKNEKAFLAAVSQRSKKNVAATKLSVEDLKKGFLQCGRHRGRMAVEGRGRRCFGKSPRVLKRDGEIDRRRRPLRHRLGCRRNYSHRPLGEKRTATPALRD